MIVLSGKQGSGKSTLYRTIRDQLLNNFKLGDTLIKEIKFADPIYNIHDKCLEVLATYGINRPNLIKDGPLLQLLGTEWGRETINKDIWVKCFINKVNMIYEEAEKNRYRHCILINTDCRFRNEFDAIHDQAYMVRLNCSTELRKERCEMWRENTKHPSEVDLDAYE